MNTFDFLMDIIPISSALLSLVASIVISYMTKKIESKHQSKNNPKISIKLNDIELEINDRNKEEILNLITKLKDGDGPKKESSCKSEMK